MAGVPEKLGSEYYRGILSQQGRAFYDQINSDLLRMDYSGKSTFQVSAPETASSDCFAAYKAVRDDHPEYFFLGFQSEFTLLGQTGALTYPILYDAETIERIRLVLRKSIYRIVRGTAHMQMIEREKTVYERISRMLSYANHNDVRDHNIVGPILTASGVCEGYNALLLLCLRRIGIPCIKVYGKTGTDGWHCWTITWIEGMPVHCDVTWEKREGGIVCFNYFNLSDDRIANDHFGFRSAHIPACPSDALSFHSRHGLSVGSFSELRQLLRSFASKAASPIQIHFNYRPASGDYLEEVKAALNEEQIIGIHRLCFNHALKNLTVFSKPT